MDLKQLEYIVMIAEENSITRGGERLVLWPLAWVPSNSNPRSP